MLFRPNLVKKAQRSSEDAPRCQTEANPRDHHALAARSRRAFGSCTFQETINISACHCVVLIRYVYTLLASLGGETGVIILCRHIGPGMVPAFARCKYSN
jgi:hypothetical protein